MDENKMPENDGWKKNARLAIYAMVLSADTGIPDVQGDFHKSW